MARDQAMNGAPQLVLGDVRDDFRDAGAHRLQQQRRLHAGGDDDHARARMLTLQDRQCRRQVILIADVEDQHVRLPGRWLGQSRELRTGRRRRLHPARAQHVLQLPIRRTYEKNICRHT